MVVDGDLSQSGADLTRNGGDQNGEECENYLTLMRLEIAEKLQRQADVEGSFLDFFLSVEFRTQSISNSVLSSCR